MFKLDKEGNKSCTISEISNCGIFIDNSGSTDGQILEVEKYFASIFKNENVRYVSWNHVAKVEYNLDSIYSTGGTEPVSILENQQTKEIYDNSRLIVFITDGEINQRDVEKFNKALEKTETKSLIIGVIVSNNINVNISVLAPFINAKNMLLLQYQGDNIARILNKNGINLVEYCHNNMMYCTLSEITKIEINDIYNKIPNNSVIINETDKCINYSSFDDFINNKLLIEDYNVCNWDLICKKAKVSGKIEEVRNLINNLRSQEILVVSEEMQKLINESSISKEKQSIIAEITKCIENKQDHSELSKKLREVITLEAQSTDEIKEAKRKYNEIKTKWERVRQILSHYENSDYSLNNFVYSSNRVNRAKVVSSTDEELIFSKISYSEDVPKIDCAICLSTKPAVLWVNATKRKSQMLLFDDFTLNYPLGLSTDNYENIFDGMFVSNPVCGYCAESYKSVSNISVYREPIVGYIPINWTENKTVANYTVFKYFADGKVLPHIRLVLFAYFMHLNTVKYSWMSNNTKELKEYFINQMLNSIYTTDTFSDEGNKCVLREAIDRFVKNTNQEYILRQPLNAITRILHLNKKLIKFETNLILKTRLYYHYFEKFCMISKNTNMIRIRDYINNKLCKTWCGLLLLDDISDVKTITNGELLNEIIFKIEVPYYRQNLNLVINEEEIRYLLNYLSKVEYDRPLKLYNEFMKQNDKIMTKLQYYNSYVQQYVKHNLKYNVNSYSPCYGLYNGRKSTPSKFYYNDIYLGLISAEELQNKLKFYLTEEYGNDVPNNRSAHINLHKIIANVLEDKYPEEKSFNAKMMIDVLDKIKSTKGTKGNIYTNNIYKSILCIIDFINIRNKYRNNKKYDINENADFTMRVVMERKYNLEDNKIKFRGMLEEKYHSLDMQKYLKETEEMYNNIVKQYNNVKQKQTILYEEPVIVKISYKNKEDLLPKWAEEQKKIVQSTVLIDSCDFTKIKYLAGMDVSFEKMDEDNFNENTSLKGVASMVIMTYPDFNVVAEVSVCCEINIPYIASYLAFRELAVSMHLLEKINTDFPEYVPDLIIVDANGVWHNRRVGFATHFGVLSGISTIAVAKNILYVDNITREEVWNNQMKDSKEGDMVDIVTDKGEIIGTGYNVTGFVKNSRYINIGNGISLETSKKIIREITDKFGYKDIEPIRLADKLSRKLIEK